MKKILGAILTTIIGLVFTSLIIAIALCIIYFIAQFFVYFWVGIASIFILLFSYSIGEDVINKIKEYKNEKRLSGN